MSITLLTHSMAVAPSTTRTLYGAFGSACPRWQSQPACARCANRIPSSAKVHGTRLLVRAGPSEKEDEELPWERKEKLQKLAKTEGQDLPFPVYLIASAIIAIAAVGSIFEIINKNPIFGVLPPSNPLWLPILGFFALSGLPSAGFLFIKAINSANAESERQNKIDGY